MTFVLHQGDCREVLKAMPDASVDSIVCDPPYELGFMGKGWDSTGIANDVTVWREALRVLKPGGHLLAFSGSRTYHRMVCAIEDAGFEVRDQMMWIYGSGFPKSLDVSKAINKNAPREGMFSEFAAHYYERRRASGLTHAAICAAGGFFAVHNHGGASVNWEKGNNVPTLAQWQVLQPLLNLSDEWMPLIEREEAAREKVGEVQGNELRFTPGAGIVAERLMLDITLPATEAAQQWEGWGTALKPAHEPICVARKPLIGTVATNVLAHGTGALNIDGCRIEAEAMRANTGKGALPRRYDGDEREPSTPGQPHDLGRWPANVIHDGSAEVLAAFPLAAGQLADAKVDPAGRKTGYVYGAMKRGHEPSADSDNGGIVGFKMKPGARRLDEGSAARFFYCAKASKEDRNEGCQNIPAKQYSHDGRETSIDNAYQRNSSNSSNSHPTVKPTDLMAYLCRLVTPPGGTVLDPFMGSGSTGKAAVLEGFSFIGIDLSAEYLAIARARIEHAQRQGHQPSLLEAA